MKICVIGLGYVGLPLAYELSKDFDVIGFDVNRDRLEEIRHGYDSTKELTGAQLSSVKLDLVDKLDFGISDVYIVTVPTPIDREMQPDLSSLEAACTYLGRFLKKGDLVIFESTVYPGCTRDFCVPILEQCSDLKLNIDFGVGYSPERINPGDKINTIRKVKKLISASNADYLKRCVDIYDSVVDAGTVVCKSIEVAEAAKILENTQRDVNIALMNEVSYLFDKIGISTLDVINAASTKWNFLNFYPGLVGGHCIGVDPYYLIDCAEKYKQDLKIIKSARQVNEHASIHIVNKIKDFTTEKYNHHDYTNIRIHVEGLTFKENCPDTRNSKIFGTIDELTSLGYSVSVGDMWLPEVTKQKLIAEGYNFNRPEAVEVYILTLGHDYIRTEQFMKELFGQKNFKDCLILDLKGVLRDCIVPNDYHTWEL